MICAALAPFVACNDDGSSAAGDDEATAASQGGDSVQVTDDEAQTMALLLDGSDSVAKTTTLDGSSDVAGTAMARVGQNLLPAGCESATQSGATVTYVFNNCTGPYGMVHLTGTVVAVYSVGAGGTSVHVTTSNFAVNESTLTVAATATYSSSGAEQSLAVTTDGSGTGPLGNSFAHKGDYTISWGNDCHTLDGSWSTTALGLARTTTVTDFSRCSGYCPAAGSTIAHTFRDGATLTLTYQGATLDWTGDNRSGSIALTCTAQPSS